MKKILCIVLALCLLAALAAGCGGNNAANNTPSTDGGAAQQPAQQPATGGDAAQQPPAEPAQPAGPDYGEYSADKPLEIILSHFAAAETNQLHLLASAFKEKVEAATGGAVQVEIVMGGVLGNDKESLESVMSGALDMAVNNTPIMSNFFKSFQVLDLPYLFKDYDHIYAFLKSDICQELMGDFGTTTGARMLCMQAVGYRNLESSLGFVHSVDDVQGLKTRCTSSAVYLDTWKTWGANALTISGPEVITALQQKTIDACDNVNNVAMADSYHDFAGYITVMEYAVHFNGLTINNEKFLSLTPDLQAVISQCAVEAGSDRTKALETGNADALEAMIADGAQAEYLTDAEKEAFAAAAAPVYDRFKAENEGAKYLEGIQALGN